MIDYSSGASSDYFGHIDYYNARDSGRNPVEVFDWLQKNKGLVRDGNVEGNASGLYEQIRRDAEQWKRDEAGSGGGGGGGGSNNSVEQNAYVDTSTTGTIGDNNTFGDDFSFNNNNSQTNINQTVSDFLAGAGMGGSIRNDATIDSSVDTTIGNNNKFGDGAKIGNNYSINNITQGGSLDLSARSSAKERANDWLKVNQFGSK